MAAKGTLGETLKLSPDSVEWSIASLNRRSDTDLFPRPVELDALVEAGPQVLTRITALDISQHSPSAPRRFIVPKDDLSYRAATQLDPLDSVILTALIYEFGSGIEQRRIDRSANSIFSYRFAPTADGALYDSGDAWNAFWSQCYEISKSSSFALVVDVADFYNQISHHTLENQLDESGFPREAIKWILDLFKRVTANVSRGIPVGPHPAHLLAEASLIPVDNSLSSRGITFCRFVDDIVLFAESETQARERLYQVAETLDKQQHLQLQRAKTKILTSKDLQDLALSMIEDQPINDLERELLDIIRKYSGGNPYQAVFIGDLSEEELRAFSEPAVLRILDDYLAAKEPNFVRLRWFLRRLAQVGHPAAVRYCIRRLPEMTPALSEICHYLVAVSAANTPIDWPSTGEALLEAFDSNLIQSNEYFQLSLLGVFTREARLDHISRILGRYRGAAPTVRREIILAAAESGAIDWLRELKGDVVGMDPWTKRAFLYAARKLPADERNFFIRSLKLSSILDDIIGKWVRK